MQVYILISPQNRLTTCTGRKSPCKRDMTSAGSSGSRGSVNWVPDTGTDISKVSNWLIKTMELAATDDSFMGSRQQLAAMGWAANKNVNNKDPLPDSILIPQYVHENEKDGRFDLKLPWARFEWKKYWRCIEQWKDRQPIRLCADPPDFCFCTHDDTPHKRVNGHNEHFFVFAWAGSGGSEPFAIRCTQCIYLTSSEPFIWEQLSDFKAPSMASNKPTYHTGTVARKVTHCTAGPATRSDHDIKRPAPKRKYMHEPTKQDFLELLNQYDPHAWMKRKRDEQPDTQATTIDMQARPAISYAPVVTGCQPLQNSPHQLPRASGPQTDTNQETTVDTDSSQGEANYEPPTSKSSEISDSEDDYYAPGQGCGTNPKLCLAIYFHIDVYLCIDIYIYTLQDIIDMLSTAHMKSQLAKQSLTKNSERRSFGQRPSKFSRQDSQVRRASLPINSPKHVSRASLPSKSSKQVPG